MNSSTPPADGPAPPPDQPSAFRRTDTQADLERLKGAREAAEARYVEALSALDEAKLQVGDMPHPPPPYDEHQISPLNTWWRVGAHDATEAGPLWRRLVRRGLRRVIGPFIERQERFNSALVDHLNRNVAGQREARRAAETTIAVLGEHLERIAVFEFRTMVLLQRLTPFIDSKDYEFAAIGRRVNEDVHQLHLWLEQLEDHRHATIDQNFAGLSGGLNGLTDELMKRWESMVARERRFDAKASSLAASHDKLRSTMAAVQQTGLTLKREVERLVASPAVESPPGTGPSETSLTLPAGGAPGPILSSALDSYKYVGFEDQFRGSRDDIRARMADYVAFFEGATDVLDVGCGRGEFLDLLRDRGITARGIDINHEMVEVCLARGLTVTEADALAYLQGLPDGSLGGLMSAQVVEHLPPDYVLRLLDVAYHKLRPGSKIVIETINPTCWFAFFESYLRDVTHVQPVHPESLAYFMTASGYQHVTVRYRAPFPEHEKLQPVPNDGDVAEVFNANVEKLNRLMFTYLDYAAVGERM